MIRLLSKHRASPEIKETAKTAAATAQVPILMYHGLTKKQSQVNDYFIPATTFESDMKYLKENGYTAITMTELIDLSLIHIFPAVEFSGQMEIVLSGVIYHGFNHLKYIITVMDFCNQAVICFLLNDCLLYTSGNALYHCFTRSSHDYMVKLFHFTFLLFFINSYGV